MKEQTFWDRVRTNDDSIDNALLALQARFSMHWGDVRLQALRRRNDFLKCSHDALGVAIRERDYNFVPRSDTVRFLQESWDMWLESTKDLVTKTFQEIFQLGVRRPECCPNNPAVWANDCVSTFVKETLAEQET